MQALVPMHRIIIKSNDLGVALKEFAVMGCHIKRVNKEVVMEVMRLNEENESLNPLPHYCDYQIIK